MHGTSHNLTDVQRCTVGLVAATFLPAGGSSKATSLQHEPLLVAAQHTRNGALRGPFLLAGGSQIDNDVTIKFSLSWTSCSSRCVFVSLLYFCKRHSRKRNVSILCRRCIHVFHSPTWSDHQSHPHYTFRFVSGPAKELACQRTL